MVAKKQMAKKEATNVASFSEERPDYLGDGSRGQEGVGVEDVTIPRIAVLQDLSPQIKKTKPEYIEGAEVGQFFNSVTGELYDDMTIIPVYFRKEWVIWRDRDSGGGFRGAYPTEIEAVNHMGTLEDAQMCEVKDTGQHFILVVKEDGSMEEAVISLSGGTMAASRQFNSIVKIAGGDRFSRAYSASALEVNGAKGDYYSFKFHPLGYVSEDQYHAGETMYDAIKSGERDIKRDEGSESAESKEF